jgi:HSP20 family protein
MTIRDLAQRWRRGAPAERSDDGFPLSSFRREMDRLFDEFLTDWPRVGLLAKGPGMVTPDIDIVESDREITVTAELPGLDEKDIEVNISDNTLTLRGEKKAEKEEKGKTFYRSERSYGAFERVIALPAEVQEDKIEAEFAKGVLTVHLPKSPAAQKKTKKIEVVSRKS